MMHRHEVPSKVDRYHVRDDCGATKKELGDAGLDGYARFEAQNLRGQKIKVGSIVEIEYLERNQTIRVCFVEFKGQTGGLDCIEVLTGAELFRELDGKAAGDTPYQLRSGSVKVLSVDNTHLSSSDSE